MTDLAKAAEQPPREIVSGVVADFGGPPKRTAATPRWAIVAAWATTGLSGAMALAGGVISRINGQGTVYDGGLALTALSVSVLAWAAYLARRALDIPREIADDQYRRDQAAQAQRAASVATALLAELQVIAERMKVVREIPPPDAVPEFYSAPVLLAAATDTRGFTSETAGAIVRVLIAVRDTTLTVDRFRELIEKRADRNAQANAGVSGARETVGRLTETVSQMRRAAQVRATWAYTEIANLVPLLVHAGGIRPAIGIGSVMELYDDLPELPRDPFADGDQRPTA